MSRKFTRLSRGLSSSFSSYSRVHHILTFDWILSWVSLALPCLLGSKSLGSFLRTSRVTFSSSGFHSLPSGRSSIYNRHHVTSLLRPLLECLLSLYSLFLSRSQKREAKLIPACVQRWSQNLSRRSTWTREEEQDTHRDSFRDTDQRESR